jgi:hypothetical protein
VSVKVMSLVWACDLLKGKPYELLAMLALADWAYDDAETCPSVAQLCAKVGMSERQWKRIKPRLIAKGLLEVIEHKGVGAGNRRTNRYKIKISGDTKESLRGDSATPSNTIPGGDSVTLGDGVTPPPGGDPDVIQGVTRTSSGGDWRPRSIRNIRKEPPTPLKGGLAVFPDNLQTPEFQKLWEDYEAHRRAKRAKLTNVARREALAKLSRWGPSRAIAALKHSLSQGWTGIFEESQKTKSKTNSTEFQL